MGRAIHFELTADDVERAAGFYAQALGWRTEDSPFVNGYKTAQTGEGGGIDGAIMTREHQAQPAIIWLEVDDLDAAAERIRAAGGTTEGEKNTIPGEGHVQYARDTEGNLLGLKQPLPPAD